MVWTRWTCLQTIQIPLSCSMPIGVLIAVGLYQFLRRAEKKASPHILVGGVKLNDDDNPLWDRV